MKGTKLLQQSVLYLKRHSPAVLTVVGSVGVIATAVLAVKATPKAMDTIELQRLSNQRLGREEEPTKLEKLGLCWKFYIPAVTVGAATISCIFGANIMNQRQQAALTSAYIFLDRTYKDYKAKVNDLFGEDADHKVRDAVIKERIKNIDFKKLDSETLLFYEEHYGQIFERTMVEVMDAEYRLNRKIAQEGEASLNDFFEFLGLNEMEIGDALGWSQEMICDFYQPCWIDFEHELVIMDDGMECYIINMLVSPTAGYDCPF